MWDLLFDARRAVGDLLLPPTGFTLVALAGLWLARKRPRIGRTITVTSLLVMLISATPLGADFLVRLVSYPNLVDPIALRTAEAIVILGGGLRKYGEEFGEPTGETLGRWTLDRVRYGARLARQTSLPVLTTGGIPYQPDGASEGAVMAHALAQEFGVTVRWQEERSRNTRENATLSAPLLREAGIRRIALVTHAFHIPRATREFAALGFEVIPAPTFVPGPWHPELTSFIPTMRALDTSYYAFYEWLALGLNGVPKP